MIAIRPPRNFLVSCLFLLIALFQAQAQSVDLRKDAAFFRKKLPEYRQWLRRNELGDILVADSVAVGARKVTLFLHSAYEGRRACDSMQCAWNQLESANRKISGEFFRERLLHKWAFLAEVHEEQAEIVIRCHEPAHFLARIYSEDGRVMNEGRSIRSAAVMQVNIPASLDDINTGDNSALLRNQQAGAVCRKARVFLKNYYRNKGTPILWRAQIDTSYAAYDDFILEVTKLSYEIIPDGFFEYHRVYVKGLQKGDDVELSWEFQGKYGSGIIFPPRKNDYKDMDARYKDNLNEYQKRLFKQLLDYLRK